MANTNKGTASIVAVVLTLVVAAPVGFMFGQRSGQKSAAMETAVVAEVNGDKITKTNLYDRMVKESGPDLVKQMINEKIVDQAAAKAGVTVTAKDIDAEIAKIKTRVGGDDAFKQALAQYNLTEDKLRSDITFRKKVTLILAKDIATDDATLKKFFDENQADFDKREVHARHILVATEQEAKDIKAQLDKGADFAQLAKDKSTEPAAKTSGGDLGFFGRGKMDPDFEKAAFSLPLKQVSDPVKTQFGYHIIQVLETKGSAPDFNAMKAEVKDAYVDQQASEKMQQWLDDQTAKAKITNTLETKTPTTK